LVQATSEDAALRALAVAVHAVGHRIRQTQHNDPVDKASLLVLWRVSEHGSPRPSEVAGEIGLDLSTISRHIRALEQGGYLVKAADPDDRRACRVTITPLGTELVQQAWERRIATIAAAVREWPEQDRDTLTRLLTRLTDDLASVQLSPHVQNDEDISA
jgi:DNA-binding MarR family transcriptional regulator